MTYVPKTSLHSMRKTEVEEVGMVGKLTPGHPKCQLRLHQRLTAMKMNMKEANI